MTSCEARMWNYNWHVRTAGSAPSARWYVTDLFATTDAGWNDGLSLKFHGARCLTINAWEALQSARGAVVLTLARRHWLPRPLWRPSEPSMPRLQQLVKAFSERDIADGVKSIVDDRC